MRVLLAGGGTAGHTSPLLATAAVLAEAGDDVLCLGTPRGLEVTLIPQAGYALELVPPVPLPRRPNGDLVRLPRNLRRSVSATLKVIDTFRPDVVVGFGGYVSVPAYLAARKRKLPLVVHEGNALPGIANKLGARLTRHVATSFPDTPLRHATYVGLPIRRQIAHLDREASRAQGREHFGLDADRPTILVTGGSQGARRINTTMAAASRDLADAGIQVLHAAGRPEEVELSRRPGDPPYVVEQYIDRIDLAYAAADLVVCRSGANTVTEVSSVGLPAVFVPLPIGNGEQALNAHPVVGAGGALLIDDAAFTPAWVDSAVVPLVTSPERLASMSRAASGIVRGDAAEQLAAMVHRAGEAGR
ncbi:undecaprenyldiphospho-muramoylpentapeptide beta-N-acetylglucosaminyltransferase [Aeromicrobium sp. 636]|uniref:UDP-N-acetylglucosamine--N-acetylmuramyl-(pentapeptide) pyrophosphoryl-undecaprenol N-acetylglucosamine transferase n=1 Tax=Aeromicrobium senzhongii TaxID=2663859 RepID=A0A8I0K060_9ACTN|nr:MULTISPECIES: undecaprenyldiphospho-muramoylpentapeptide beta-N-acetylglucosaminyltransferase [Aeromicrobium]MBC9225443.1 undecaprenyldiphospho-muramoylpentapeptide beta-N-acetylglucosaminyltransferase [Aeromicrobium senzhongii]MCQ3997553.1 undecaprenyldiphospho-muramoylpentapeptide beta-N-acetylglucosaminyltransferase [Aeromicrobium sp. 636]MTB87479.1 undecaprenyldiphospho-muramoylpentapeptide beta-N-acetylglucosaminyltransferase [Aeromicrobium senzhongii]QNL95894.1 undecaprenyldiphospho-mu